MQWMTYEKRFAFLHVINPVN